MQLRLRRTGRHPQQRADLLVPIPLDIVEHEDRSRARRQLFDGGLQIDAPIQVLRACRRRHIEQRLAVCQESLPSHSERSKPLDDDVHRQPVQPRRERRLAAKQGELLPRADEYVLRQFIGCVGAGHPPREVENPRHVRLVDPLESRRISFSSKDDVVHRHLFGWLGGGQGWNGRRWTAEGEGPDISPQPSAISIRYGFFEKSTVGATLAASGAVKSS